MNYKVGSKVGNINVGYCDAINTSLTYSRCTKMCKVIHVFTFATPKKLNAVNSLRVFCYGIIWLMLLYLHHVLGPLSTMVDGRKAICLIPRGSFHLKTR